MGFFPINQPFWGSPWLWKHPYGKSSLTLIQCWLADPRPPCHDLAPENPNTTHTQWSYRNCRSVWLNTLWNDPFPEVWIHLESQAPEGRTYSFLGTMKGRSSGINPHCRMVKRGQTWLNHVNLPNFIIYHQLHLPNFNGQITWTSGHTIVQAQPLCTWAAAKSTWKKQNKKLSQVMGDPQLSRWLFQFQAMVIHDL